MSDDHVEAEAAEVVESLSKLRAEHIELMRAVRRDGHDEGQIQRIHALIDRVKRAGKWIDSPSDRDAAQNIITYWASHLFSAGDRQALSATLPTLDAFDPSNAPDLSNVASPFQGLGVFGEDDAGRFFGREEAAKTVVAVLRGQPVMFVVGPMGSGKTSLVMAGVVPRVKSRLLVEDKHPVILVVVPGADPFAAMLRSIHDAAAGLRLAEIGTWISEQKRQLQRSPQHLHTLLGATFQDRPVLLVVEQLEQIFTLCTDAKAREQFAQALVDACPNVQTPNRAILIIDEQSEQLALQLPALKPIAEHSAARFYLPPLTAAEAERIIENAGTTVGLKFDEGIVEDLAKGVAGDVRALPTLQFTLSKLWNERERNRITWDAYRKVGKPREALKRTADGVFESLSSDEQWIAKKLFLKLVRPTTGGNFTRHRVRRDVLYQIDSPDKVGHVLTRYVEAGLIRQTNGVAPDDDRFDVPHEALVDSWPLLRDWLERERQGSEKILQLVEMARLWQRSGGKSGYLLSGSAMDDAAPYMDAAPELKEFIAASQQHVRRQSRRNARIRNGVIVVMGILLVAAILGLQGAIKNAELVSRSVASALTAVLTRVNEGAISASSGKALLTTPEFKDLIARSKSLVLEPSELTTTPIDLLPNLSRVYERIMLFIEPTEMTKLRAELLTILSDFEEYTGNRDQSLAYAERADTLAQQFVSKDPKDDEWQRLRYEAAFRVGDLKEVSSPDTALQKYYLALEAARTLAARDPSDGTRKNRVAFIQLKIGDIFMSKKSWKQSREQYEEALAIGQQLMTTEPERSDWQKSVADAHQRISDLFAAEKDIQSALTEYRRALPIRNSLASKYPQNDFYQSNLSTSYFRIGDLYKSSNEPEQALEQYQKALALADHLALKNPDYVDWKIRRARLYEAIADVLAKQDTARALENYRQALTIREELIKTDPSREGWRTARDRLLEKINGLPPNSQQR